MRLEGTSRHSTHQRHLPSHLTTLPSRMPSITPTHYSTMFHGGIVNIRDATLNMPIHQVNEFANRDRALDLLRSYCSLAALVDASQRYDPPRCAKATRREIIQRLEDWIRHDDPHGAPSSIFWLYGGAGAGKSALAQSLAEKFKTNEDLAASFFFFKTDVNRNDGNRLIPTLALQLAQSFQGLTPIVEQTTLRNPDLFKKNHQTQILRLLIEPLMMLALEETNSAPVWSNTALRSHPRLIVIDGLDECADLNLQCDLLRIIARAIPHFPYPLRFLITSRPESHITRTFQYDLSKVAQYDLSDDSDADKDIRMFLDAEFAKILRTHPLRRHLPPQWPPPGDINSIAERSSAHFIYASTVIRFIRSPKHRPDDRLQVILGLKQPCKKERPYAALDLLYSLIFLEIQDPNQLEKIQRAFGIMHLRNMTQTGLFAKAKWTSDLQIIEVLLELRPGDIVLLFDPLLSLVTFDKDNIRTFHKSLFDYLLDSSRSGDLQLDLGLAHESAANHILREKRLKRSWDLTEFEDFAYHCQFAPLNDILTGYVLSLACDPKITFAKFLSRRLRSSERSSLLQSILLFLQVTGRQDFDSSGHYYKEYVRKTNQCLRSAVPLRQRLKRLVFLLMRPDLVLQPASLEGNLRLWLRRCCESIDLNDLERRNTTGFNGRTIPAANTGVIKSIEQEHEMFSSYVKVHHRFPDTVLSVLEDSAGLIHSCHFVIQSATLWVTLVMLATYTEYGVRLSCSEFEGSISPRAQEETMSSLMEGHFRSTQEEVNNNHTKLTKFSGA